MSIDPTYIANFIHYHTQYQNVPREVVLLTTTQSHDVLVA